MECGVAHAAWVISRIWLTGTRRAWAAGSIGECYRLRCAARAAPVGGERPGLRPILGGVNSGQVHSGLIIVDKPQGWTSHDVVGRMRRLAGTRKVGHAGTLDPMATGVLVIGVNRATRLLTYIVGTDKTYTATIRLGQSTITDDAEGEITGGSIAAAITPEDISAGVLALTGTISQVPSSVSAIKVKGQRAYARVRSGEDVQLEARSVTVSRFEVHDIRRVNGGRQQDVDVTVECSSGTYIRALARDLGTALGVGGHLTALRRTRVGPYTIEQASTLDQLAEKLTLLELDDAGRALFPVRELSAAEADDVSHGRKIPAGQDGGPVAAYSPEGTLVALLENRGQDARALLVFAPGNGPA
ncbi:tRNA pseudouridine(55) synthase TruB [Arthrobacter sp. MSA 4-2]|nr:tRNA pseudouridine(55) synthase TruB [Arthrobacter sp. MSA 4-2]